MKNHIGRTLLVLILFIHSLTSLASSHSKYTPLIRQVRGWPSEKILSKGDQFLQNKEEDKALVMYMLVCSRTNGKLTITPSTAIEGVSAETLFGGKACDIFSLTGQLGAKTPRASRAFPPASMSSMARRSW